jgi:hypothetical protein
MTRLQAGDLEVSMETLDPDKDEVKVTEFNHINDNKKVDTFTHQEAKEFQDRLEEIGFGVIDD